MLSLDLMNSDRWFISLSFGFCMNLLVLRTCQVLLDISHVEISANMSDEKKCELASRNWIRHSNIYGGSSTTFIIYLNNLYINH